MKWPLEMEKITKMEEVFIFCEGMGKGLLCQGAGLPLKTFIAFRR